jgi:LmbE family N-acetylglucosaminyl deacetylase
MPHRNDANEDHRTTYKIVAQAVTEADLLPKTYEYLVWNGTTHEPDLKASVNDIHKELARKIEAISKYKSQTSTYFPKQKKPVLSQEFINRFRSENETFYTKHALKRNSGRYPPKIRKKCSLSTNSGENF